MEATKENRNKDEEMVALSVRSPILPQDRSPLSRSARGCGLSLEHCERLKKDLTFNQNPVYCSHD